MFWARRHPATTWLRSRDIFREALNEICIRSCRLLCSRAFERSEIGIESKLTVRRETLRAPTNIELTRAAGEDDPFTGAALCSAQGATGTVTCPVLPIPAK